MELTSEYSWPPASQLFAVFVVRCSNVVATEGSSGEGSAVCVVVVGGGRKEATSPSIYLK